MLKGNAGCEKPTAELLKLQLRTEPAASHRDVPDKVKRVNPKIRMLHRERRGRKEAVGLGKDTSRIV